MPADSASHGKVSAYLPARGIWGIMKPQRPSCSGWPYTAPAAQLLLYQVCSRWIHFWWAGTLLRQTWHTHTITSCISHSLILHNNPIHDIAAIYFVLECMRIFDC